MFKKLLEWLGTKHFILSDLALAISIGVLTYAAWPSLQSDSKYAAIAVLAIMVILGFIGLCSLAVQVIFIARRKHIDLRVYEYQQLGYQDASLSSGYSQNRSLLPGITSRDFQISEEKDRSDHSPTERRIDKKSDQTLLPRPSSSVPQIRNETRNVREQPVRPFLSVPGNRNGNTSGNRNEDSKKPVPDFLYRQGFHYLNRDFTAAEQEHVISMVKNQGVKMRDLCSVLKIGKPYYPALSAIVAAYEKQIGE